MKRERRDPRKGILFWLRDYLAQEKQLSQKR